MAKFSKELDAQSQIAVGLVTELARERGYNVNDYQRLGNHEPALFYRPTDGAALGWSDDVDTTHGDMGTLPDLMMFKKDTRIVHCEVKVKKALVGGFFSMDDFRWKHLLELEDNSNIPSFFVIYSTEMYPIEEREPRALICAPTKVLLKYAQPPTHGRFGSFRQWPAKLFRPLVPDFFDYLALKAANDNELIK